MISSMIEASAVNIGATCEITTPLTDFDGHRYMGAWYEQVHTANSWFQDDSDTCSEAYYHDLDAEGYFTVENTGQDANYGPRTGVTGKGYCPDKTGQCYVAFYGAPYRKPNYVVIDTDYETYSVVYCCDVKNYLWLLTSEPVVSDKLYNHMLDIAH